MTTIDIEKVLNKDRVTVSRAAKRAANYTPSIYMKLSQCTRFKQCILTEEECAVILKELNATELQTILFKEYVDRLPKEDYYVIQGTQEYIKRFKKRVPCCCDSCKFLSGKLENKKHPQPFCSLFDSSLKKLGMNVYKDFCPNYDCNNEKKPILWYTDNAPTNLDKFGNTISSKTILNSFKELEIDPAPALCGFFSKES